GAENASNCVVDSARAHVEEVAEDDRGARGVLVELLGRRPALLAPRHDGPVEEEVAVSELLGRLLEHGGEHGRSKLRERLEPLAHALRVLPVRCIEQRLRERGEERPELERARDARKLLGTRRRVRERYVPVQEALAWVHLLVPVLVLHAPPQQERNEPELEA